MTDAASKRFGVRASRLYGIVGASVVVAGLVVTQPSTAPLPGTRPADVRLTAGDASDSVALVMGGSGTPTPPPPYVDFVDAHYLQPNGFTGTAQALTTIETFSDADKLEHEEAPILTKAVEDQIAAGHTPVYVFAYSQSAAFSTFSMQQLAADEVSSDDVHFVMVGDPVAPDGGFYTRLDIPPGTNGILPINDTPLGNPTPDDLFPTDVYTMEYDPVGDFPRYPIDPLSDLNALIGLVYEHLSYLGVTSAQVADAAPLEAVGGTLDKFFMMSSEYLPLLVPVALIPIVGQPLYDLLEPDMRILVNLGYGSIDEGWDQGPANVETPVGLLPTDINLGDLATALVNGLTTGVEDAVKDLLNPATYELKPLVDNPVLANLIQASVAYGGSPHPSSIFELLGQFFQSISSGSDDGTGSAAGDLAALADGAGGLAGLAG